MAPTLRRDIDVKLSTATGLAGTPAQGCPRQDPVPLDVMPLYILKQQCREQVSPALNSDDFGICGACFSKFLTPYPELTQFFEPRKSSSPEVSAGDDLQVISAAVYCDFAMPTVRHIFYQQCLSRISVIPFLEFANLLVELPGCVGALATEQPVEPYESIWNDQFACCKTCFECFVRETPFERQLVAQLPQTGWSCDIGTRGFAFRALLAELEGPSPDFLRFSAKVKQRNALPPCPGVGVPIAPSDSTKDHYTFEAVNGKSGVFCQSCYWDKVLGTSMEPFFNVYTKLDREYYGNLACDLAGLPETFALRAAIRAGDDEIWRRCAVGRATLPKCVGVAGVDEENLAAQDPATPWYYFTEQPSIEVCPLCYCAVAELLGAGFLFTPISRPLAPGVVRMCFLAEPGDFNAPTSDKKIFENTLVWRGSILRQWIHHGYDYHSNFDGLKHAAKVIASLPLPCGADRCAFKPVNGRKWYGNHFLAEGDDNKVGIAVCQECYTDCIKDTPLEWFVGVDLTDKTNGGHPGGFVCNASTRRVRDELRNASEKGDFLQFARYWAARKDCEARRKAIDAECQRQAERQAHVLAAVNLQGQAAYTNLMGQLTANTNAVIAGIGGSVAEAAAVDHGQRYGNSTIGYGYLTSAGAGAAQAHTDAANLARKGVGVADFRPSGDMSQDSQRLLALSREVEEEWKSIA
ncbi:hypothetical protein BX600DRAFT_513440 [Xylariales sp. PMI_506]|nr:hypothetical protein BX600DRAFT_513440 [Xylariales sp. PMI_506]